MPLETLVVVSEWKSIINNNNTFWDIADLQ